MAVYLFTSYDLIDEEAYAPYVPNVMPILERHGGEIVASDESASVIDGEKRDITVILKFPDEASAMNMAGDPEYQPWMERRLAATENRTSVLIKGFDPDSWQ